MKLVYDALLLREIRFTMELFYFINLIFIFVLNVLFFFSGICLNSLVIISFWRSVQLRTKLCYFMILVLSCCDLLAVLNNSPLTVLTTVLWLTESFDVFPTWVVVGSNLTTFFSWCSLLALLVLSLDRYLATYYSIFHRTSVTKGRLLTLLLTFIALAGSLVMTSVNSWLITPQLADIIFMTVFFPSMLSLNYELFIISRRRCRSISGTIKRGFSLKSASSCLLAVACFLMVTIPVFLYVTLGKISKGTDKNHRVRLAGWWANTMVAMNATFNSLNFYWKNNILRTEGMKVVKSMNICRRIET